MKEITSSAEEMIRSLILRSYFLDTQFRIFPHMLCRKKTQPIPMVTPHMLLIFIQMAEVWAIAKVDHIIGFTTPSSPGTLEIILLTHKMLVKVIIEQDNSTIYFKPAGKCTQYYTHTNTNTHTHNPRDSERHIRTPFLHQFQDLISLCSKSRFESSSMSSN